MLLIMTVYFEFILGLIFKRTKIIGSIFIIVKILTHFIRMPMYFQF